MATVIVMQALAVVDKSSDTSIKCEPSKEICLLAPSINLLKDDFPLLQSLGIQKIMEMLLSLSRKKSAWFLHYMCPTSMSTDRYNSELSKKGGPINSFLHVISNSTKCSEREAEESILIALLKKQEEAFTSVVLEKGL